MIKPTLISLFAIVAPFLSCKSSKTPDQLKKVFYQNKETCDRLVTDLRNINGIDSLITKDSTIYKIGKIFPKIKELINEIGITEIIPYEIPGCKRVKQFFIKTDWSSEYPIHLIFNSCDSIKTIKGYYSKDEVDNETWGLGDHWSLFRLVKEKTMKQ